MAKPMVLDSKDFDARIQKLLVKSSPRGIRNGLGRAGAQWLTDCVMRAPTVPLDEGTLRGSGSVHVDGEFYMQSTVGKRGEANLGATKKHKMPTVEVGFNTPYAAALHESVNAHFTQKGSGAKYLEQKMKERKKLYMKIVANALRKELDRDQGTSSVY